MVVIGAVEAVAQLGLVLLFGGVLAFFEYITPKTRTALHRFTQVFLAPILIYFSIAFTSFTLEDILAHWHMVLFFLTLVILIIVVSWLGTQLAGFSRPECQWVAASILFQDSTLLPLAIVQALANSVSGVNLLLQGPLDSRQGVAARGIGYVAMYSFALSILQSLAINTLLFKVPPPAHQPYSAPHPPPLEAPMSTIDSPLVHPIGHNTQHQGTGIDRRQSEFEVEDDAEGGYSRDQPWVLYDDDYDDASVRGEGDANDEYEEEGVEEDQNAEAHALPRRPRFRQRRSSSSSTSQRFSRFRHWPKYDNGGGHHYPSLHQHHGFLYYRFLGRSLQVWSAVTRAVTFVFETLSQIFTAPVMAAILALLVGVVPALHHYIMEPEAPVHRFIVNPLEASGACAIPLILLGTGAKLLELLQERRRREPDDSWRDRLVETCNSSSSSYSASQQQREELRSGEISLPVDAPSRSSWLPFGHGLSRATSGRLRLPLVTLKSLGWFRMTPTLFVLLLRNAVIPLLCLGWTLLWRRLFTTPLTSDPMWCNATVLATLTPLAHEAVEVIPVVHRTLFYRYQRPAASRIEPLSDDNGEQHQQRLLEQEQDDKKAQEQLNQCYFLEHVVWLPALSIWLLLLFNISSVPRARAS